MMKRVAWVVVITLWVFILASSLFTRVEADDYCFAALVDAQGITGAIRSDYYGWTGLFTDRFISGVFAIFEPYGTRIGIPLMLAGVVAAWWYTLSVWYTRLDALLVSLAFGAALVMSRPNDEPIYWLSGATSYWFVFAGAGLLVGALLRRRTLLAALTAFLSVSLTEAGGALIVAGLGLAFLFWKGERTRLFLALAAASFGFLLVFLAPGNSVRAASLPPIERTSGFLIFGSLAGTISYLADSANWTVTAGIFLSGIAALFPVPSVAVRTLLFTLLATLVAGTILAITGSIAIASDLPFRTVYILTPFWLMIWFQIGNVIGRKIPVWRFATLIGIPFIALAAAHTIERIDYAQRWDARHAAILAGDRVPRDIGSWDTLTDTDWGLACAESWYGREIQFMDGENVP